MSDILNVVELKKGARVSINKDFPFAQVELSWDVKSKTMVSDDFDLDVMAFSLDKNNHAYQGVNGFHYYNMQGEFSIHPITTMNMKPSPWKHIFLSEDSQTGESDGVDECLLFIPEKTPSEIERIQIWIVIYDALNRKQNFGMVQNTKAVIKTDTQTFVFDLTEDHSTANALAVIEFYRHNGQWKINALEQGHSTSIDKIISNFNLISRS